MTRDPCDSCNATALVELAKVDGVTWLSVWFCAHHYRRHAAALASQEWEVLNDYRDELGGKA